MKEPTNQSTSQSINQTVIHSVIQQSFIKRYSKLFKCYSNKQASMKFSLFPFKQIEQGVQINQRAKTILRKTRVVRRNNWEREMQIDRPHFMITQSSTKSSNVAAFQFLLSAL